MATRVGVGVGVGVADKDGVAVTGGVAVGGRVVMQPAASRARTRIRRESVGRDRFIPLD